ncbi:YceD family protein [Nitratireductor soli]|uniref:YceD family protein n=1 Tax=Nitratireductor soli TaxID=1670619 RepID=UPI00065E01B4|nr:DUF177 domain-containing protein [Nitratireductor soli]
MSNRQETSPVSFRVNVLRLPRKGMPVDIEADAVARTALAEAHALLSVERFRAELMVRPWKSDGVRVIGRVRADITQACVVTLEPLTARIDAEMAATLVPETSRLARNELEGGEFILDAEGPDLPDTFAGDTIDIGALAEEFFALAIDPYPRKPGSAVETEPAPEDPAERAGPLHKGPLYEGLRKLGQKS